MSETLRDQFRPKNSQLEVLNQLFIVKSTGVRTWSFVEVTKSKIVRPSGDIPDANRVVCTPDYLAILGDEYFSCEDEHASALPIDCAGIAQFRHATKDPVIFLSDLGRVVRLHVSNPPRSYNLHKDIMTNTYIVVNQFWPPMRCVRNELTLKEFLAPSPDMHLTGGVRDVFTQSSDDAFDNEFAWIDVPYNIPLWVPKVLTALSRERGILDLYQRLLSSA